eukprot:jgi/Botrbrau1/14435/Bobra.0014s0081.1
MIDTASMGAASTLEDDLQRDIEQLGMVEMAQSCGILQDGHLSEKGRAPWGGGPAPTEPDGSYPAGTLQSPAVPQFQSPTLAVPTLAPPAIDDGEAALRAAEEAVNMASRDAEAVRQRIVESGMAHHARAEYSL